MKFEYSVIIIGKNSSEQLKDFLDKMGNEGWELIQFVDDGRAIFKRPIPEQSKEKKKLLLEDTYARD